MYPLVRFTDYYSAIFEMDLSIYIYIYLYKFSFLFKSSKHHDVLRVSSYIS